MDRAVFHLSWAAEAKTPTAHVGIENREERAIFFLTI